MTPESKKVYCANRPKRALKIVSLLNSVASMTAKQTQKKTPVGDKEKERDSACGFHFELVPSPYRTSGGDSFCHKLQEIIVGVKKKNLWVVQPKTFLSGFF